MNEINEKENSTTLEDAEKIQKTQKIRSLLNEGKFIELLPYLSKEEKNEFVDIVVEAFNERNSKLFWRQLEFACSETQNEAETRRIQEDIQEAIALEDLKRSQKRNNFRDEMTTQLETLHQQNSNGAYLSTGDRHFLEDNDEALFRNSEQNRTNKNRQQKFNTMDELGKINDIGESKITEHRITDQINRLIREKQEFILNGGDLNDCKENFDKKIQQLYSVLDDINQLQQQIEENGKKVFTEEREKQRQLDISVRNRQVNDMQKATQNNSIGGISK